MTWAGWRRIVSWGAVGAALVAAAAAATSRPGDRSLYPARGPAAAGLTVYVVYNGFHSDLEVPASFLARGRGAGAAAAAELAASRWVALGWGDATFYQGQGLGPARLLAFVHSAVWPRNASVVHLSGEDDPLRPSPGWKALRLTLSPAGAEKLRARLDASFALRDGRPWPTGDAPPGAGRPQARFFRSRENAWALHVCNHWTAELLNAAGAPITPMLDLTTAGLEADLRWRSGAVAAPARPAAPPAGPELKPPRRR